MIFTAGTDARISAGYKNQSVKKIKDRGPEIPKTQASCLLSFRGGFAKMEKKKGILQGGGPLYRNLLFSITCFLQKNYFGDKYAQY